MSYFQMSLANIIAIIIVILLIYSYVYKFYLKVKLYPSGPLPLPFIGNILMITTHMTRHPTYLFKDLSQKYGDIFTFWLGTKPIVVLSGISLVKNAFNKYEICDRFEPSMESKICNLFSSDRKGIGSINVSDEFKLLRTIAVQAMRKYISTNKLTKIVHEIVSETVDLIKKRENNNAFVPNKYITSISIRIVVENIFGKRLAIEDKLIDHIFKFVESAQNNLVRIYVSDKIPLYKYLWNSKHVKEVNDRNNEMFALWYKELVNRNKNANNFDSIAHSLISSANAVRDKNKGETNQYLTESNMIGILIDLVFASTDTTYITFKWILLLMSYYQEMQRRMRIEVNDNIGKRIPDISDKENCVFVYAFICETLRFRTTVPYGVMHLTSCDTTIEGISIPKGTSIMPNQFSILNDPRYWKNPDVFNPERFIDCEQKLIPLSDIPAFIPFTTGKRMCVGDKFAMISLFISLLSLLQSTNGYKFVLLDKQNNDLEPKNSGFILDPRLFKVILAND